jgi:hypothetical protein
LFGLFYFTLIISAGHGNLEAPVYFLNVKEGSAVGKLKKKEDKWL